VPDHAHRTAVLCFDVEGVATGLEAGCPVAVAGSPVIVLHALIPYLTDDSRQPYSYTEAGRETYRQASINLAQLTGPCRDDQAVAGIPVRSGLLLPPNPVGLAS
jgi:hypothetical protein